MISFESLNFAATGCATTALDVLLTLWSFCSLPVALRFKHAHAHKRAHTRQPENVTPCYFCPGSDCDCARHLLPVPRPQIQCLLLAVEGLFVNTHTQTHDISGLLSHTHTTQQWTPLGSGRIFANGEEEADGNIVYGSVFDAFPLHVGHSVFYRCGNGVTLLMSMHVTWRCLERAESEG